MFKKARKFNKSLVWFSVLFGVCLVIMPLAAGAQTPKVAKLYFLPSSGTYEVGKTFSVRAAVDTGGQAINAVETIISFSKDTLEVTGLSKEGVILSLWVSEPSFNNDAGTVSLVGGIPNPGFDGLGRLLIINFKVKSAGDAWVKFNSGQVLANDGFGTNILGAMGRADFTIKKPVAPQPVPVEASIAPSVGIKVYSPTHPDSNQWYERRSVIFAWTWSQGMTDFSYTFDQNLVIIPDNEGKGMITSISYLDVEDGVWYFHLKAKTASKGWKESPTSHFKIQIDRTPPEEFKITSAEKLPTANPSPLIRFEAEDKTSGIDHYEVKINQAEFTKIDSKPEYQISTLRPGKHQITVRAVDKAKNFRDSSLEIEILPLEVPKIIFYTKEILYGESLIIKGKSLPNLKINFYIFSEDAKELNLSTNSNEQGDWLIKYEETLKSGKYRFYVNAETITGAVSSPSEEKIFEVYVNAIKFLFWVIPAGAILSIAILLIVIILALIAVYVYTRIGLDRCRKGLNQCKVFLTKKGKGLAEKIKIKVKKP